MKIQVRECMRYSNVWIVALMPTMAYVTGKAIGITYNKLEFIWWILIPVLWIAVLLLKFKIAKTNKEAIDDRS